MISALRWGWATAGALTLYVAWTLATWLLEVRIHILLRPEAALDRVLYAVANILIGTLGAVYALGWLIRASGPFSTEYALCHREGR